MAEQFVKSLVIYFSYVETLNHTWPQITKALARSIVSLKNQSQQLCHVSGATIDNAEIYQINFTREKLNFKINMGIDDEIVIITNALHTLNNHYKELKNKFTHLQTFERKISEHDSMMNELVKGTSYRPQLCLLLESAMQVHEYYSCLYQNINASYIALNRNDLKTIERFASSLNTNNIEQAHLTKVLAITQFFINKTII